MTPADITVDYLAHHPQLADQLAKLSWSEWRFIYEQRGETFRDALSKYRERLGQRTEVRGQRSENG